MVDVSKWSLDQLMQLPDCVFGRRYWVGAYSGGTNGVTNIAVCEERLPDKLIAWGMLFSSRSPSMLEAMRLTARLTPEKELAPADIDSYELLFKGIGSRGIVYEFYIQPNALVWIPTQRQFIESKGRTIAFRTNGDQVNTYESDIGVLISSVPKEVPDWVVSGLAGRQ